MLRVQLSAKWIVVFLFQKVRKKKVSVVQAKKLLLCLQQRITIKKKCATCSGNAKCIFSRMGFDIV